MDFTSLRAKVRIGYNDFQGKLKIRMIASGFGSQFLTLIIQLLLSTFAFLIEVFGFELSLFRMKLNGLWLFAFNFRFSAYIGIHNFHGETPALL